MYNNINKTTSYITTDPVLEKTVQIKLQMSKSLTNNLSN